MDETDFKDLKITIEVENTVCRIRGLVPDEHLRLIDSISRELSYKAGYLTWTQKSSGWDGLHRLLTRKQEFPAGCLNRVVKLLRNVGIEPTIDDRRVFKTKAADSRLEWKGRELYPYQKELVQTCLDNKLGMVKAATGAGKSIILSKLTFEYDLPSVIYVVSGDLLQQMHEELSTSLNQPVGMIGGGHCQIERITVCSVWSAGRAFDKKDIKAMEDVEADNWTPNQEQKARIRKMVQGAELCILDEAQFAAADSIKVILANSRSASHRFGFSGTPWRTEGDDILLEAAFGERICDLSASRLIELGYLVPAHFVWKEIPKKKDLGKTWNEVKAGYITANEERDRILIDAAVTLIGMGRRPLILFRELKHGKALKARIPASIEYRFVHGSLSMDERKQIRDDFKAGKVQLILASTVYDQGVDLPGLDALILAGGGKSSAKALQRVGRVIRGNKESGKKDAIVVETYDQAKWVQDHSRMRYEIYKTEPAFRFKTTPGFENFLKKSKNGFGGQSQ